MKMPKKRCEALRRMLLDAAACLSQADVGVYAAHAAYFIFFSAIPLLMLVLSALDFLAPSLSEGLVSLLEGAGVPVAPQSIERFLHTSVGMVPATALAVLWAASRGMRAVGEGISSIYHSGYSQKNIFLRYIYSFLYTVLFVLVVLLTLGLLVFGRYVVSFLDTVAMQAMGVIKALFFWRYLIAVVILISFFALLYRLLGKKGMVLRRHLPGAVFAGCGWVLFSFLFSQYLKYFSVWENLYGSLSVIMILIFWVYGCMYILMLGAVFNCYLERFREKNEKREL